LNAIKRQIIAVAIVVSALSFGVTPAHAGESPFQDYLNYQKIVDGNGDPSELSQYVMPNYRAAFDAKSADEKAAYCKVIRNLFQMHDIKLRSESKAGNEATVIFDCQGMATVGIGSTMGMQPLVGVATMTKSDGTWITQRLDMKRPKEFAAVGTATASSINNEKQWCADGHKLAVPNKPLSGLLQGSQFTLESTTLGAFSDIL
jgi:hypothetical protein